MTYKEFNDWCNDRACDGCWGLREAMTCVDACKIFNSIPFWKREKVWQNCKQRITLEEIVTETNKIIEKVRPEKVF